MDHPLPRSTYPPSLLFLNPVSYLNQLPYILSGSSIKSFFITELVVKSNPSLKEINIVLSSPSIISGLTIADNPELTTVKISATDTFAIKTGEVRITGNKALTTVDLPSATTYDITGLIHSFSSNNAPFQVSMLKPILYYLLLR